MPDTSIRYIMHLIKYDIKLDEKSGRPYIDLPEDYDQIPENKFFALEMTRYVLQDLHHRKSQQLDENTVQMMENSINFLGQISDSTAEILYHQMKSAAEMYGIMNNRYDILVNSIEERDAIPMNHILYEERIYDRKIGLKVCVVGRDDENIETYDIYELIDGVTNEHWVKK